MMKTSDWTQKHLAATLATLGDITQGCRVDMHEPDEQDLKARVVGFELDNATGSHVSEEAMLGGYQEFVVVLERHRDGRIDREQFNLATLIALARMADVTKAVQR
jgi:hypothetical protein